MKDENKKSGEMKDWVVSKKERDNLEVYGSFAHRMPGDDFIDAEEVYVDLRVPGAYAGDC